MHTLPGPLITFNMGRRAFWTGALLSFAVGQMCYLATANAIESDARHRFDSITRSVQTTINARVKGYSDVLRGAASLFQTSNDLTREQFHRYVEGVSLEEQFPGIETINYARYVTDAERPEFEASMRKEFARLDSGYPPFRIQPPGHRASYNVITYIEPVAGYANRFGFDMTARGAGEKATIDTLRDTGQLAASGTPIPVLSGPNRTVLAMRLPIYRNGMRTSTVEERRAAFLGSVGIGFTVQKLINGVLDHIEVPGMRLTITDIRNRTGEAERSPAKSPPLLFDTLATVAMPAPPAARPDGATFLTTLPVGWNMRLWEAKFSLRKADLYTGFDLFFPWLAMLAGFVSTMLLYSLFHTLTASRRNAVTLAENMTKELRASEAKLKRSNENLRRLGAHAENIKEGERKRIAREIHDDLGQNLLVLRIEADMLSARTSERQPRLHARARATVEQIDATIKSVRQIINDLRPNVLDLGLNAAVDWQIAQFRRRTGMQCDLTATHQDIAVSDHCATALFRILQESLSNISRHSQATRVQVVLRVENDWIWMSVGDNGVGVHAKSRQKPGSFGLVGIEERINILGGSFDIHSEPGNGTTIRVAVPMRAALLGPAPLGDAIDAFDQGTELV